MLFVVAVVFKIIIVASVHKCVCVCVCVCVRERTHVYTCTHTHTQQSAYRRPEKVSDPLELKFPAIVSYMV